MRSSGRGKGKRKNYSKSHIFSCIDTPSHLTIEMTRYLKHHVKEGDSEPSPLWTYKLASIH